MKQFGTTHMKQRFCKCCVPMDSPRAKVKAETFKLIKEEEDEVYYLGHSVSKDDRYLICSVCGGFDDPKCVECC